MRYVFGGVIVFVLALVQASSVQQFHALGVAPNLMLVFLVAWLVARGLDDALPMIGVAGVTLGLIGLQTPGLVMLALLPVAAFGVLRELHIVHSDMALALALVAASTIAYESIMLASIALTGGAHDIGAAFSSDIIPALLVNLAITPPVYLVMRFARPTERRHRLSY